MFDLIAVSPSTAVSFFLTSLLIEMTPGPNMTYLALVSASEGRRAGFAAVAGVAMGLAVIGVVAAFGVAEIIHASIYNLLRWAGVLFLFHLAWDGWRSQGHAAGESSAADGRYFSRGLFTESAESKSGHFLCCCFTDVYRSAIAVDVPGNDIDVAGDFRVDYKSRRRRRPWANHAVQSQGD